MSIVSLFSEYENIKLNPRSNSISEDSQKFGIWNVRTLKQLSSYYNHEEFEDVDRTTIWKMLFGDKPMPSPEDGIIENDFGKLNHEIKTEVPFDNFEDMFDSEDY